MQIINPMSGFSAYFTLFYMQIFFQTVHITPQRLEPLFHFESANLIQIGQSVCLSPEIDMFSFHIVGLHIQPDEFFKTLYSSVEQ